MTDLEVVADGIRERAQAFCEANTVPGYVAGVYHRGVQSVTAYGIANIATGTPMHADTGFLIGSVTKVLTTTLVMRQVDRGVLGLDDPVVNHLPQLRLTTPGAAERIRVRDLLSHTNGIDADLFFPNDNGPGALTAYATRLGESCGALFPAGEYVSYSNGGMIVAGRLLEAVTGTPYSDLLQRELYATVGMPDSSTSAEEAILRSTAVGHFADPVAGTVRRTDMFKLPDSWAPAGASAISTVADLLAFARTHLAKGLSPIGQTVLSAESAALMQTVAHDMGTPGIPPLGLGWLLMPFGDTTAASMSGASPGGVSVLVLVPEHDFAFVAFGNEPQSVMLHDEILLWLLRDHLQITFPDLLTPAGPAAQSAADLSAYAGTYRSCQLRVDVRALDGQLEEEIHYEPADADQEKIFTAFAGGTIAGPPRRYVAVGKDLFAPAGLPLAAFNGYLRQLLVSYHDIRDGRARYRSAGGRMTRREDA
jgi:CubicO group peptidase (beta-lactamase class C family)